MKHGSHLNGTEVEQILSSALWLINLFILVPIEIWWTRLIWVQRRNPFISKRRPRMLLMVILMFWIWYFLVASDWVIHSFIDYLSDPIWRYIHRCGVFTADLAGTIFTAISISRWWLLFYSKYLCFFIFLCTYFPTNTIWFTLFRMNSDSNECSIERSRMEKVHWAW